MKEICAKQWMRVLVPGAVLVGLGGCLGPNPGFFIGSSLANATITTVVNTFLSRLLELNGL